MALEATRLEQEGASSLVSQLEERSEAQAQLLIENDRRFQVWGLVQALMDRSQEAVLDANPRRAIHLARLANEVANRVDQQALGDSLTNDLRGRASTNLGNAYRYGGQLKEATEALRRAGSLLAAGTGDPLEEANLWSIRSSLALSAGTFAEALGLLARAERIYTDLGEFQLLSRILVKRASVVGWEDPRLGVELSLRAEGNLDPRRDTRLFLVARHNRIIWTLDIGQAAEAQALFESSVPLYRQFDDEWTLLHRGFAEARLAFALADLADAEDAFQVLFDELLAREQHLNAALLALDLAQRYLSEGETRKASELAGTMAQNLREWGAHARARDAWAILQHALAVERATRDLVRQLARYLYQAWRNPHVTFRPGLKTRLSSPIIRS